MGLGSRTARRHLTAKAVEAASAGNETYWDFKPGQRVMTCDGFPGVVAAVHDGPFPGNEEYQVTLDGGLGGGAYTASQLREEAKTTASHEKTAADDYPELGNVLVDRPDIAINTVLGSKTAHTHDPMPRPSHYGHGLGEGDEADDHALGHDSITDNEAYERHMREYHPVLGSKTASGQCNCEHINHFAPGHPASTAGGFDDHPREAGAHDYHDAKAGKQNARYVGPVCDWCAGHCMKNYLLSSKKAHFIEHADVKTCHYCEGSGENPNHWGDEEYESAECPECGGTGRGHPDNPYDHEHATEVVDHHNYLHHSQNADANHNYIPSRERDRSRQPYASKTAAEQTGLGVAPSNAGMGDYTEGDTCPQCGGHRMLHSSDGTTKCENCGYLEAGDRQTGADAKRASKFATSGYDLLVHAATDPSFRMSITASWSDVRNKAKRLRSEGGVKITAVEGGQVIANVQGDHDTYETILQHHLGSHQAVSAWNCGCAWAKFAWGRSGEYRRYEGRMCSHALATQFEVMSRKMFGREMHADDDGARLATFVAQESPVAFLVQSALASGEEPAEMVLALRTAGIASPQRFVHLAGSGDPSGMSTGEGIGATGDPVSTQGPTTISQPNDNPASTGWASGPDPADWGQASNFGRMGSMDESIFDPEMSTTAAPQTSEEMSLLSHDPDFGAEAELHMGNPEGALPTTDGGEDPDGDVSGLASHGSQELDDPEGGGDDLTPNTTTASLDDLIADFQATAGKALMESGPKGGDSDGMNVALAAKMALKDFSPAEQQALINEGATEGVTASNLDRLDIAGTHYEALEAALASANDDDDLEF